MKNIKNIKECLIKYSEYGDEAILLTMKEKYSADLIAELQSDPSFIVLNFYDQYAEAYDNCQFGFCTRYSSALSELCGSMGNSPLFIDE